MTKQEFLVISNLLAKYDFDELDRLEFVMCFERETGSSIPDEWIDAASLPKPEEKIDWDSFRREAAKDILASMLSSKIAMFGDKRLETVGDYLDTSIAISDELIKQLREEKK